MAACNAIQLSFDENSPETYTCTLITGVLSLDPADWVQDSVAIVYNTTSCTVGALHTYTVLQTVHKGITALLRINSYWTLSMSTINCAVTVHQIAGAMCVSAFVLAVT